MCRRRGIHKYAQSPTEQAINTEDEDDRATIFTLTSDEDEVLMYQMQDKDLQRKIKILREKTPENYNPHEKCSLHCLMTKTMGKPARELHPIPPGVRPFDVIHVDHLGPFIKSTRGNKYILVMINNLTKFVKLMASKNTNAENVVKQLTEVVMEYGAPNRIVTDRGTCFTSAKFTKFCTKHGIQHILNLSRHAQANGMVERYEVEDLVFMKTVPQASGESTKLQPKNRGPLIITKILPNDTYGIMTLRPDALGRKYTSTAHEDKVDKDELISKEPHYPLHQSDNKIETDDERPKNQPRKKSRGINFSSKKESRDINHTTKA
ncbi:transposon ty3-g gag-pol polyprotein isoform x2 [Lasius niger]|uniref:Transposon ty3-g gag-pol polyprotein isoform x2 n=1 Tax=Lasius niger TaxID=67767 RepID=A0A0J7KP05_LASNI|nr:transposon ty3-g gag-pol polyprotein isoform x2 [Lasius niger]